MHMLPVRSWADEVEEMINPGAQIASATSEVQVVYLGGDPMKNNEGMRRWEREGRKEKGGTC